MSSREIAFAAAGVGGPATYIEDVFSTYLYNGTGSVQTINNGIDLAGEGGMVWTKTRSSTYNNALVDTVRGGSYMLFSNTTGANYQLTPTYSAYSFNSNGYSNSGSPTDSLNGGNLVSWTFRKQPKFFDVVTYTGDGSGYLRRINHSLQSRPGLVIIKCTSSTGDWNTMATLSDGTQITGGGTGYIFGLNSVNPYYSTISAGSDLAVSTTSFAPEVISGFDGSLTNASGQTYVAYLFANNAGGFGLTGTDNVISCGSFTTDGSGNFTVNLGYEPQYVMAKASSASGAWLAVDIMRGFATRNASANTAAYLQPNSSAAESTLDWGVTSTGFTGLAAASTTYIYMAIRRPMKVPTDATTVFSPVYVPTVSPGTKSTTGFPIDLQILSYTTGTTENQTFVDRLRGISTTSTESGALLISSSTAAEATTPAETRFWDNTGFQQQSYFSGGSGAYWNFSRRPGFFDEVCYTGTGSATTVAHNLGVAPELMIVKRRDTTSYWIVYSATTGNTKGLLLNDVGAAFNSPSLWNNTSPVSTNFTVGINGNVNDTGATYVAYLFATCPGVSKVGSYTGTGATQTINCGFTGGARFVLIKRTDSTGDWYVWDTARGMVAGTDPSLLLNSTAAEVNANSVYTATTGFQIVSTAAGINASGGSYIYLAIA